MSTGTTTAMATTPTNTAILFPASTATLMTMSG